MSKEKITKGEKVIVEDIKNNVLIVKKVKEVN